MTVLAALVFRRWYLITDTCAVPTGVKMCPEFASGHRENDRLAADRRYRNHHLSPARTISRCASDKDRNVTRKDKCSSRNERAARVEDRETRCSVRIKNYCVADTERKSRTDSSKRRSPLSDCRHEETHVRGNRRLRSRSPCYQKVSCRSDDYRHREERNDLLPRKPADSFDVQGYVSHERSPYRDRSSRSKFSTCSRSTRPDDHVDVGTRHSTDEPEHPKYQDMLCSNDGKLRRSEYIYADLPYCSDRKIGGTKTSSRHCDEQITSDNAAPGRGCTDCDTQSRAGSHRDLRHSCHVSSGYCERKVDYRRSSAASACRCCDSNDRKQPQSNVVCDRHCDRTSYSDSSSAVFSRYESNHTWNRDRRNLDGRSCTSERRRTSPRDRRYSSTDDRRWRTDLDSRQSSSRCDRHRLENRRTSDKDCNSLLFEESSSKERRLSRNCRETVSSSAGSEKSGVIVGQNVPDGHSCRSKEDLTAYHSRVSHMSQSVMMSTADADKTQCTAHLDASCTWTAGKPDAVSSGSEYAVTTSWTAAHGDMFLGSPAQLQLHSGQHLVGNGDRTAGGHLPRPQWPVSTVNARHAVTNSTGTVDFVPTAAITQLPLSSTRTSTVSLNMDPRRLNILSGVSLNSTVKLTALPSDVSLSLAAMQPAAEASVGQCVMNDVYGDSPLLDEPSYYSPVPVHESSLNLVGSSISSSDYLPPELMQSTDTLELQKVLDVVTLAKTTLEQTLPASCQTDPRSLKHQKVICLYLACSFLICL